MALYAISDLHLSHGVNKPMGKFGARWTDHAEKIRKRWSVLVEEDDTVVIPGDISWAMTLSEAAEDFRFLESLPGKKILSKGNHDYWWTSVSKMNAFLAEQNVTSVQFLLNNAFLVDDVIVCGSRGWFLEEKLQSDAFDADYEKLVQRECLRLTASLTEGQRLAGGRDLPTAVFLHFPPVYGDFRCEPLLNVMKQFGVTRCYYGHIHGNYEIPPSFEYEGVNLAILSADYLNFIPARIFLP